MAFWFRVAALVLVIVAAVLVAFGFAADPRLVPISVLVAFAFFIASFLPGPSFMSPPPR
jgi:hypothetical protein